MASHDQSKINYPDKIPVLWGAVYLILEPINVHLGYRSLLEDTARGIGGARSPCRWAA